MRGDPSLESGGQWASMRGGPSLESGGQWASMRGGPSKDGTEWASMGPDNMGPDEWAMRSGEASRETVRLAGEASRETVRLTQSMKLPKLPPAHEMRKSQPRLQKYMGSVSRANATYAAGNVRRR